MVIMLFSSMAPPTLAATADDDPENDVYSISLAEFFLTVAPYLDEPPETEESLKQLVNTLVASSDEVDSHAEIDIDDVEYEHEDGWAGIFIEFYGSVEDEEILVFGFGKHDGDRFSFNIQMNASSGTGDVEYTSEAADTHNETTAWINPDNDKEIAFIFKQSYFDWDEGDTLMVLAMTSIGEVDGPEEALSSNVFFDFSPNEELSEGSYLGDDFITSVLDYIANFLFGFLPGGLPFKLFMAILIIVSQVFLDRKKKWMRWFGFISMLFWAYPIIMYMIPLFAQLYNPLIPFFSINPIAFIEILILWWLIIYIALASLVSFNLLNRKNYALIIAYGIMNLEMILYLMIFSSAHAGTITGMILMPIVSIASLVILKFSRKRGRTPKNK